MDDPGPADLPVEPPNSPGLGSTVLASRAGQRRRWPTPVTALTLLVLLLIVAAVIVGLRHGHGQGSTPVGSGVARPGGFRAAASLHELADAAAVRSEAMALLAGRLAAVPAPPTVPASPSAGPTGGDSSSTAATPAPRLGAALSLADPGLGACLSALADGATLLAVDRVSYQGSPALLVVVSADQPGRAEALVVGPACAEPGPQGIRTAVIVPVASTSSP